MGGFLRVGMWIAVMGIAVGALAQQPAPPPRRPAAPPPKAAAAVAPARTPAAAVSRSPYRRLAPGIMNTVDPQTDAKESIGERHDVIEILTFDDKFDWAKDIPFRRDVWHLDFKFKNVRMISVDVPAASGRMQRKLVWYMVYSVTNPGKIMHPVEDADRTWKVAYVNRPIRFVPVFTLEVHDRMAENEGFTKSYVDQLIPVAVAPIRHREDPNRQFYTTVEMSRTEIAVGETRWGVVTWTNVDPRTKRFSIFVEGLTNAYYWKDLPPDNKAAFKREYFGDGTKFGAGRRPARKVLQLNFWRPSDEYFEHEEEIRYGLPGHLDYEWIYQ